VGFYFPNDDAYDKLYQASAEKYGPPASLLKGMTAAESEFDPKSVRWEPSGRTTKQSGDSDASRGLMQSTQAAVLDLGWPVADKDWNKLFDPAASIEWGTKELAKALANPYWKRPGGKPDADMLVVAGRPVEEMAAATYNMGYPRAIERTTKRIASIYNYPFSYRESPPDGWHFANQPYINMVISFYAMYSALDRGDADAVNRIRDEIKKKELAAGNRGGWEVWRWLPAAVLYWLPGQSA